MQNIDEMTVSIVKTYVSHHEIIADEVPLMINKIYRALSMLGNDRLQDSELSFYDGPASYDAEAEEADLVKEEKIKPAISIEESVKKDSISCLICGKEYKMLKRHLRMTHKTTIDEYREMFSLGKDYPVVAPSYSKRRREIALDIYLGRV